TPTLADRRGSRTARAHLSKPNVVTASQTYVGAADARQHSAKDTLPKADVDIHPMATHTTARRMCADLDRRMARLESSAIALVSRSTSRPRTSLKQHTTTTTTKPTQRAARTIPEPAAWLRSSMRPALPDPATWSLAVSPDSTITIPEPTAWLGSGRQPSKKALRLPSPTSLALAAWFSSSFDATINPSSLDRSTAPCSASPPFTPSAEEQGAMELGMEVRPEEAIPTISKVPVRLSVAHFNSLQSPLERMITQFRQNSPEHDTISPLSDQRGEAVDTDVDLEGWWDQALLDCSKEGDTPLSISTVAHVVAVAVEPHLGVTSEVAGCVLEGPTFCTRSIGMEPTGANGSLERSVSRRIGPGVGGGSRRTFPARLSTFVHGAKGVFRFEAQGPV
ncbi:hypothetical protein FRB95_012624, partial [Tulasnella sp. JGI-2019a]